jgi:hypothetical protein
MKYLVHTIEMGDVEDPEIYAAEPIINFDYSLPTTVTLPSGVKTEVYSDTNVIYTVPSQISMDPQVCLINTSITSGGGNKYLYASQGEPYVEEIAGQEVGKVMNIYVNFMYILKTMDANLDESNKVPLITFLQTILRDICNSLGSINSLEPFRARCLSLLTITIR